jgi:hypothetical protein
VIRPAGRRRHLPTARLPALPVIDTDHIAPADMAALLQGIENTAIRTVTDGP